MKIIKIGLLVFGILIVTVSIAFYIFIKNMDVPEIEIQETNLSSVEDGVYQGHYEEGLVDVDLEVEVKNNEIINITLLKHDNGLGGKGEKIIDKIIENQSLEVDAISGATISSNVIKRAVYEALQNEPID